MPSNYAVVSCNLRGDSYLLILVSSSFFRFPKDPALRAAWIHKCARQDKFDPTMTRVCSQHFMSSDYDQSYLMKQSLMPNSDDKLKPRLKPDADPTLNLPTSHVR